MRKILYYLIRWVQTEQALLHERESKTITIVNNKYSSNKKIVNHQALQLMKLAMLIDNVNNLRFSSTNPQNEGNLSFERSKLTKKEAIVTLLLLCNALI